MPFASCWCECSEIPSSSWSVWAWSKRLFVETYLAKCVGCAGMIPNWIFLVSISTYPRHPAGPLRQPQVLPSPTTDLKYSLDICGFNWESGLGALPYKQWLSFHVASTAVTSTLTTNSERSTVSFENRLATHVVNICELSNCACEMLHGRALA